jgi:hypothetical protein
MEECERWNDQLRDTKESACDHRRIPRDEIFFRAKSGSVSNGDPLAISELHLELISSDIVSALLVHPCVPNATFSFEIVARISSQSKALTA